ncbi:MAG TPA: hypothetical protein VGV90_12365 [Solirubrobacteraceae bacterium]|nr:hypothetical protein [Solirubrobacteraceae bacterium]
MAQASRPLIAVVVLAFVLVTAYLLTAHPAPQPPERSKTPFAPLETIDRARDASAASDAANQAREAAADAVDAP